MKTQSEKYCFNCGGVIDINAEICPKCGVRQFQPPTTAYNCPPRTYRPKEVDPDKSKCDWLTTLLLCIFLGGLGIHRFYTQNSGTGVIQLLTCGGLGIWWLVDLIMLITNKFKDGTGKYVKE